MPFSSHLIFCNNERQYSHCYPWLIDIIDFLFRHFFIGACLSHRAVRCKHAAIGHENLAITKIIKYTQAGNFK